MDTMQTTQYARALMQARGPRAIAEAARRMRESEDKGDRDEADNWRRIRLAMLELRGPHQS
ncbi:hypothetical protein SAMN05216196_103495 [Lutimaribacter pacificus]|uniref:Uncharacterized protein n=1 Tax=Lutimaribacter pacificus TaxID=391948 RepID=A0A1H0H2V0_9RHOB|nr:hypothetical protein [Lutimaribacter pacificus]SDO13251.1 hypothetical protein SAMN05216196_103495 [Lutimaribacter pacificus]SHJ95167.1 hypothetical protein SAMN05444142_102496 [Lutimaribacter pacificus]